MKIDNLKQRAEMATKIAMLRLKKNISQAKLAELSGVRQATISELETGTRIPKQSTIDKLYVTLIRL